MGIDKNNTTDEEAPEEGGKQKVDFWSDEGARRFNEMLDEGSAYASGRADLSENFEDEECEYLDSEISEPGEETLPPGEMELIFENCFIM